MNSNTATQSSARTDLAATLKMESENLSSMHPEVRMQAVARIAIASGLPETATIRELFKAIEEAWQSEPSEPVIHRCTVKLERGMMPIALSYSNDAGATWTPEQKFITRSVLVTEMPVYVNTQVLLNGDARVNYRPRKFLHAGISKGFLVSDQAAYLQDFRSAAMQRVRFEEPDDLDKVLPPMCYYTPATSVRILGSDGAPVVMGSGDGLDDCEAFNLVSVV